MGDFRIAQLLKPPPLFLREFWERFRGFASPFRGDFCGISFLNGFKRFNSGNNVASSRFLSGRNLVFFNNNFL